MLKSLFLRLRGDVVGALLNDRDQSLKMFISVRESLKDILAALERHVTQIDADMERLEIARKRAWSESQKVYIQLEKIESFL